VPVAVVNARVSDRSMARLRRAPWLARRLWGKIARVTAASQEDGERIAALGFPRDRLDVCGNLKFDAAVGPVLDAEARERLRHELGLADGPVLMGSSTWPGEEEALLAALGAARAAGIGARLLVVPRHAERRGDIADVLERSGFSWHLRSRGPAPEPVDVCLADTTGEMVRLLQAADVVFIGRSLPPNDGGQTPVESAALGKAMIFGPNMTNFRSIARALVETGGAALAQDAGALAQDAVRLLRDPAARAGAGRVAQGWHGRSRGAVERTIEVVRTMAGLTPPERAAAGAESTRRQTRP
jgi:3-deoxy-D-manno-octulosonic-acid transferase